MKYLPSAKLIFFSSLAGFLLVSTAAASIIKAQEDTTEATTQNIGVQVSAPVYNFGIDPGNSAQEIIKIRNVSSTTQTFYPEVLDFKPVGETGAPQFLKPAESGSYTFSLASWITVSTEGIVLKPNEAHALNFTINVPKDAEPGGRYAGILFGTTAPELTGTGVAISNKVWSLVLVRVAGDAKEVATLKEFSTDKPSYEAGPVNFVVRVQNAGNVHVVPKGNIEIKDTFGRSVASLPVNETDGNVLPDSVRRFVDKEGKELSWKPEGFTFGRYKAQLLLTCGSPAKTLSGEVTFWIVPWKQLLVIGLVALIAILLLVLGVKRYNRYVVNRALKNQNK